VTILLGIVLERRWRRSATVLAGGDDGRVPRESQGDIEAPAQARHGAGASVGPE
jgi:hypothetical protein